MSERPDETADAGPERARAAASDRSPEELQAAVGTVREEVAKRIVGQEAVLEQVLACMLCDGNALLESNPGLGKTSLIRTVSDVTDLEFSRIQNTPDLMPADVTGTEIIREAEAGREFTFERGPVFANVVLADEINRATPKTQAALLEAMEEKQVTVSGETYPLPSPFFLLATQNPVDQEGTYPLPEAQKDRFLMKITLDYPAFEEEQLIVDRYTARGSTDAIPVETALTGSDLLAAQRYVRELPIADDIRDEAIGVVQATREADRIEFGASPRASIALVLAAKARAFIRERAHVERGDIEAMAAPVLRHRIVLDFRAEQEGTTPDEAIDALL
jgi:MoxR-like ATPase